MPRPKLIDLLGPAETPQSSRRKWLSRLGWASAAAALGLVPAAAYAHWIEPHWLDIVERDLPISKLPRHWQGKRLAHVSDIHVGPRVSDDYSIKSFQRLANLKPDVVVVTGDFVSHFKRGGISADQVHAVYSHLPQGAAATLGILGNHDYGPTWSDAKEARKIAGLMTDHGVKILRNETVDVNGLEIIGLDELWAGRCDAAAGLETSSPDAARLVLCHNPDAADRDMWGGYQGWILAGHTHGGQCRSPFLPPFILPVANKRYTAGEIDLYDGRHLYISRGLGHSIALRFNVRPEITLFRLVAATD